MKVRLLFLVPTFLILGTATKVNADAATIDADIGEFFITLDQGSVEEGQVVINVDNQGSISHVIAINGTSLSTNFLWSGSSVSLSGTLSPGTYNIVCTISGHESAGMSTSFVVNASSTTLPTTVPDSSTTTETTSAETTGETQLTVEGPTPVLANSGSRDLNRLGGGILMVVAGLCIAMARRAKTHA